MVLVLILLLAQPLPAQLKLLAVLLLMAVASLVVLLIIMDAFLNVDVSNALVNAQQLAAQPPVPLSALLPALVLLYQLVILEDVSVSLMVLATGKSFATVLILHSLALTVMSSWNVDPVLLVAPTYNQPARPLACHVAASALAVLLKTLTVSVLTLLIAHMILVLLPALQFLVLLPLVAAPMSTELSMPTNAQLAAAPFTVTVVSVTLLSVISLLLLLPSLAAPMVLLLVKLADAFVLALVLVWLKSEHVLLFLLSITLSVMVLLLARSLWFPLVAVLLTHLLALTPTQLKLENVLLDVSALRVLFFPQGVYVSAQLNAHKPMLAQL